MVTARSVGTSGAVAAATSPSPSSTWSARPGVPTKNLKGVQNIAALRARKPASNPAVTLEIYSDTLPPGRIGLRACANGVAPKIRGEQHGQQLPPVERDDHRPRRAGPRGDGAHQPAAVGAAGAGLQRELSPCRTRGSRRSPRHRPGSSSPWSVGTTRIDLKAAAPGDAGGTHRAPGAHVHAHPCP